jgi:glycosyltransferase involved in cell wall biosynthesis
MKPFLKILLVSPLPPPLGGIGIWTTAILAEAKNHDDISIHHIDISPRWRAVYDIHSWKRLIGGSIQLARDLYGVVISFIKEKPDVMHLTTSGQFAVMRDYLMLSLGNAFHVPSIYHIHMGRIPEISSNGSKEWAFMKMALRKCSIALVIDPNSKEALDIVLPDIRTQMMPNFIEISDLGKHTQDPHQSLSVLYIGHVFPTKGIAELVGAWCALDPSLAVLTIAGPFDPSFKHALELEIQRKGCRSIAFLGGQSHQQALDLIAAADVIILPSYTEGFPNVVLEAMAAGKPIIASRVGAIPEMLGWEEGDPCGILIPPKDEQAIIMALQQLLENPQLRITLGMRARLRVTEQYSLEKRFANLIQLWQSIAESKPFRKRGEAH